MKKYHKYLLFVCFSFVFFFSAFFGVSVDRNVQSVLSDFSYNSSNITLAFENSRSNAGVKSLKYIAVFIEFSDSDTLTNYHLDDDVSVQNAKKIFNSDRDFEMMTANGVVEVPSFKRYFEKQSYGKLSITTEIFPRQDGTVVSYRDSRPMGYYLKYSDTNPDGYHNASESLQRETELVERAVSFISSQVQASGIRDSDIDSDGDGVVDAISFFIEGADSVLGGIGWGDLLWSHKSDNMGVQSTLLGKRIVPYNIIYTYNYTSAPGVFSLDRGTYGTIIHEFGHTLGYVDLYRFDRSGLDKNKPVGFYDIMGDAVGSNPQNFLTYFISEYNEDTNFHDPMPVISDTTSNITLSSPQFLDSGEKRAIKIQTDSMGKEFFVVEYHEKQNTYSSHSASASGLIVYRVNENNKYAGNKDGGDHGEKDHVFIFRPNETGLGDGNGNLSDATLNMTRSVLGKDIGESDAGFDPNTIYYSDGSNSGIVIEIVSQTDDSVTFSVIFPKVEGDGSITDPYLIYDVDTFFYFMGSDTKGKYYKLMNDLDFGQVQDYPKLSFLGHLDGNGKTLHNIHSIGTGVFDSIGDYNVQAVVENLYVENISVIEDSGSYLGGFASMVVSGTVRNVHLLSGNVHNIADPINSLSSTGGFAGNVSSSTIIENCSSNLDVYSDKNVGGFIGINMNATIRNSFTTGVVSGNDTVGGFIGQQMISDSVYHIPSNVYYDYTKSGIQKAVGGYATGGLHNLTVLPADSLGKGIVGVSVLEEISLLKNQMVTYSVMTVPDTTISFDVQIEDSSLASYGGGNIRGIQVGSTYAYVSIMVGNQTMKLVTKLTIEDSNLPSIILEEEVLRYFGLTKKDDYISGFSLGSDISSVKQLLSSYVGVDLAYFQNSNGQEISTGMIATGMKFALRFSGQEYHYTVVVMGDVNGDGKIYATDYVKIRNHIMGKSVLNGAYLLAADVNGDGKIYATDYVKIRNYIMGKGSISQSLLQRFIV